MRPNLDDILEDIAREDSRYHPDAYEFVLEALHYTQKRLKRNTHVTGRELLRGIKELLIRQYGPMIMTVLNHWGVVSTEDFGHIVFKLVEKKILSKTQEDSLEDFRDVYDFKKEFEQGYRRRLAKKISRMR